MPTKPLRIAIVSRDFGDVGGAERFAARLAEGVAEDSRYEVHVFASRPYHGHPAIRLHQLSQPLGPRLIQKPLFAWLAQRALAQYPPFDLIHTHEPLPGADIVTYGTPHAFWMRHVRQKKWLGLHDHVICSLEKTMFAHPHCQRILPMSGMVLETLQEYYPALARKFVVLQPGIDLQNQQKIDRFSLRQEIRAAQKMAKTDPVALFIGNNYHHKGLDSLLQAMSLESQSRLQLWVIGRGPIEHYQAIARRLGLEGRVTFLGLVRTGLEKWLLAADFLVLLSTYETFGMVVLEALANGLPVLISDQIGAKDLVQEDRSGWIIPANSSPSEIAAALTKAVTTLGVRDLSDSAREAASQCSWKNAQEKILEIYEDCLSNKGNGRNQL